MLRSLLCSGFMLLLGAFLVPLQAQEPAIPTLAEAGEARVQVTVLGVFHFHNPNADYAQFEGIDVRASRRLRGVCRSMP